MTPARLSSPVARALDRIMWMRLEVLDSGVRGVVLGVRHRRPVQVPVGETAALRLLRDGVPTVVRVAEARS